MDKDQSTSAVNGPSYPVFLPATYEEMCLYYEFKSKTYIKLKPSQAQGQLKDKLIVKVEEPKDTESLNTLNPANQKKRSRGGCLTCRHRKKRCSEEKPKCFECSRLNIKCKWPIPGRERKNRNKEYELQNDEVFHEKYGVIKVLRGVVEYKIGDIDEHYREMKTFETGRQHSQQKSPNGEQLAT